VTILDDYDALPDEQKAAFIRGLPEEAVEEIRQQSQHQTTLLKVIAEGLLTRPKSILTWRWN